MARRRRVTQANPVPEHYWTLAAPDLLAALGTSAHGLTEAEAAARLRRVGPNSVRPQARSTPLGLFIGQFRSAIVVILLVATVISAVLHDWVDAVIIFAIILGSALLSFYQEYSAGNAAGKLLAKVRLTAKVMRDGEQRRIPVEDVVPGDVVALAAGDLVPADGVLLEARDLFANESALTGETFPAAKEPGPSPADAGLAKRTNCVYMGTSVRSGTGSAAIVTTGRTTALGQIAHRLAARAPETDFEHGVRRLGYLLSEVMFVLVLAVFATNVYFNKPVVDSLLFSLALAVGLTPQLLPAIISVNLAKGSQAMAERGVIVRRLAAIENFGSMDVLCTDKTGTLTEGSVQLQGALDPDGQPSDAVLRYAYINARLQTGLPNPMDQALQELGKADVSSVTKLDEIPYDFVRKRLSVVVRDGDERLLIAKGALAGIVSVASGVLLGGETKPIDDAMLASITERATGWAGQGIRTLGVAIKPVAEKQGYGREEEDGLTFVGFLLFYDPPKSDARDAVAALAQAGVALKMITGDDRLVAQHVASLIGLASMETLTGADVALLTEEALARAAQHTSIFAEVDPTQKEHIIHALRLAGHVVGYMGDGINDAPALHAADVGISVDTAVDVAKDAASFVLMRQDLGVLRQGIIQGRATFINTQKYVFMATSANFGNMFSVAGASLFLPFLPLLPKQILLINFLTDLPEMAIATDNVDGDLLERPRRWDIRFIRRFMFTFGPLSSIFDYLTFAALFLFHADPVGFRSVWFVESVLSAAFVVYAVRTRRPIQNSHPSRTMLAVTAAVALVALAIPFTPLASLLGFRPLTAVDILVVLAIIAAYLAAAETAKRVFYRRPATGA